MRFRNFLVLIYTPLRLLTKRRQLHCIKGYHCFVSWRHTFCIQYKQHFVLVNVFTLFMTSTNRMNFKITRYCKILNSQIMEEAIFLHQMKSHGENLIFSKSAGNYILICAGGTSRLFTYLRWIGLLLKASWRKEPPPVILEQIHLNWNKKQSFEVALLGKS